MVVFGRPKGDRGSYQQWKEGGVGALEVVFEVCRQTTVRGDAQKFSFYQRDGVEEYYIYDPDTSELVGCWQR